MHKQTILVTGGGGFIGSHLCELLLSRGNDVICLDNFFTGSKNNIRHLLSSPSFELIRHDVTIPIELEVDAIYNLACPASPIHYQHDPVQTIRTNILGAMNMLELARRLRIPILQSSTSEIYGDPKEHPQLESYWGNVNPIGVRSCYDEGKRVAETLLADCVREHGVDARMVRIFNTYGPKMHPQDGRVVSNFIMQALRGEDLTVYGDGSQTRSFQYCDDLIDAFRAYMSLPVGKVRDFMSAHGLGAPVVNTGNPGEFTIRELAEMTLKMIPESKSRIAYRPLPGDDPKQRRPDITLAKELLGWEPRVPLAEGLAKTIAYFRGIAK